MSLSSEELRELRQRREMEAEVGDPDEPEDEPSPLPADVIRSLVPTVVYVVSSGGVRVAIEATGEAPREKVFEIGVKRLVEIGRPLSGVIEVMVITDESSAMLLPMEDDDDLWYAETASALAAAGLGGHYAKVPEGAIALVAVHKGDDDDFRFEFVETM